MVHRFRRDYSDEGGFTLIELLVVVLVVGILSAVAIPLFLGQNEKAYDATAKSLAGAAATTAETVATDNDGSYSSLKKPKNLQEIEKTIPIAAGEGAYISKAKEIEGGAGYEITATADTTEDKFTIKRLASGAFERTCTPKDIGGCPTSKKW